MRAKRLRSVLQIKESDRFAVLADGLDRLVESVAVLSEDADSLAAAARHRGAAILRSFADEEAAKIMIILDLARAGWTDHDAVGACMSAFYSHLARGLYVRAYDGSPADVAEVRRYLDGCRQEFYLDGPMDVDWIFGNEVLTTREELLYVDYIEDEDGETRWAGPAAGEASHDSPFHIAPPASQIVSLTAAMHHIGLLTVDGLSLTHAVWEGIAVADTMQWSELQPLNTKIIEVLAASTDGKIDVTVEDDEQALRMVRDNWIFPLTTLDLKMIKVDVSDLKQRRKQRIAREMGYDSEAGW